MTDPAVYARQRQERTARFEVYVSKLEARQRVLWQEIAAAGRLQRPPVVSDVPGCRAMYGECCVLCARAMELRQLIDEWRREDEG